MSDEPTHPNDPLKAGHFEVGGEIARGGMGSILEVTDQKLRRTVAMKRILLERDAHPDARRRFIREATILARLEHPNVVPIHELGKDDQGRLFYVMKKVEGRTLQSVIHQLGVRDPQTVADYSLDRLLTVFVKVCDAMAFAHSRGGLHRDLKPENVMIGEFGEVLVMDWGLAKFTRSEEQDSWEDLDSIDSVDEGERRVMDDFLDDISSGYEEDFGANEFGVADSDMHLTMDGAVIGSPQFMPPEQAAGRIHELDERADIFSLGAILYAILTLHAPAWGDSVDDVLEKVKSGDIIPPSSYGDQGRGADSSAHSSSRATLLPQTDARPHCPGGKVPAALSAVAMRALAFRPEDRYQQVPELSSDIEAYRGGYATSVENVGLLGQLWLLGKRHKGFSISATLAILLTVGFVIRLEMEKDAAQSLQLLAESEKKRAVSAEGEARQAQAHAEAQEQEVRKALVRVQFALAEQSYRNRNWPETVSLLKQIAPELRDASWRYLRHQANTTLKSHPNLVQIFWATPDSNRPGVFGCVTGDGDFRFYHVREARFGSKLIPDVGSQAKLALSPDGKLLATADHGQPIQLRSIKTGDLLWTYDTNLEFDELCFDGAGKSLFCCGQGKILSVSVGTGKLLWQVNKGSGPVDLNSAGLPLVHAGSNFRFFDPQTGELIRRFGSLRSRGLRVVLSPDGKRLLHAQGGGVICCYDVETGQKLFSNKLGDPNQDGIAFLPDGQRYLVTRKMELDTSGCLVEVRDSRTGAWIRNLTGGTLRPRMFAVHPLNGDLFMAGLQANAWAVDFPKPICTVPAWGRVVYRPLFDKNSWDFLDDQHLMHRFSPSGDLKVIIVESGQELSIPHWFRDFGNPRDAVLELNEDRSMMLLESMGPERDRLHQLLHQTQGVYSVTGSFSASTLFNLPPKLVRLSPRGDKVLSSGRYHAWIADSATGKDKVELKPPTSPGYLEIQDAVWMDGGRKLACVATISRYRASPGSEERIFIWNTADGKVLAEVPHPAQLEAIAVDPDGSRLVEAGADRRIRVRSAETLDLLFDFQAHDSTIKTLAWHPTRPILASGGDDHAVRLWNADTGDMLGEILGMSEAIAHLRFSPDGSRIGASTDEPEALLRIWDVDALLAGLPQPVSSISSK